MTDVDTNLFWNIHIQWTPYMFKRSKNIFGKNNALDVIQDYMIYFMKYHIKHFKMTWECDAEFASQKNITTDEFVKIRAKNFYLQRFVWYISQKHFYGNKERILYSVDENSVSSEFGYSMFENITTGNKHSTSDMDTNSYLTDEFRSVIFQKQIDKNIDFKIYLEQFIEWVEEHVEKLYKPTKDKIVNFLKEYQKYGVIELNIAFGTSTAQYRKLIANLIRQFDDFLYFFSDKVEGIEVVPFQYEIIY